MFVKWRGKLLNLSHIALIETYCNEVKDPSVYGHVREAWGVRVFGPNRNILTSDESCTCIEDADATMRELENLCIRKNYEGGMSGES